MGNLCNETRPRKQYGEDKTIISSKPDERDIIITDPVLRSPTDIPPKPDNDDKNRKFTYRSAFNFIPQIEIKFNEVKEITKELIDNLILKLNQLFPGKDVKIIEMKKGSLDIAIALNYLIQEALRNTNIHNISVDKLLETLNDT